MGRLWSDHILSEGKIKKKRKQLASRWAKTRDKLSVRERSPGTGRIPEELGTTHPYREISVGFGGGAGAGPGAGVDVEGVEVPEGAAEGEGEEEGDAEGDPREARPGGGETRGDAADQGARSEVRREWRPRPDGTFPISLRGHRGLFDFTKHASSRKLFYFCELFMNL